MILIQALDNLRLALRGRVASERGAVTIEYGVIVVFIALALITVVGVLVGGVNTWFGKIANFIQGQPGG
jgi:Flp pilus assembly pilin Flp